MENELEHGSLTKDAVAAPYAEAIIPLFLTSVTGFRYRTLCCMECGADLVERNNDTLYRLNDQEAPTEALIDGTLLPVRCGNCGQRYAIQVSLNVALEEDSVPLHLQPQSVYIIVDSIKKLRYLHCLECGKPFHSISDRIRQVVDNRVPFEFLDPLKVGPLEALCHRQNCGQTWALMI